MEGLSSSERHGSRTGYACDSCKRQKIKCSGGQPCKKCASSGVVCAYGSTLGRSNAPYIKHLEDQISDLKQLLRQQTRPSDAPSRDQSSSVDISSQSATQDNILDTIVGPGDDYVLVGDETHSSLYHGQLGGLSVLRAVRGLCGHAGTHDAGGLVDVAGINMAEAFDSPALEVPARNLIAELALLPSPRLLKDTISVALDCGITCKECLHREELWSHIDILYARDPEDFSRDDKSFLALVYSLLALGRRHSRNDDPQLEQSVTGRSTIRGMSYFRASRSIIDSLGCADLNSIMAHCCLASYLLSCSMISKAYGYICTGISESLRMGLHVSSSVLGNRLSEPELTKRRRVFAVLNLTAVVIASVLGMPNLLRDADRSQLLPISEDDLADEGTQYVETHPSSPISATICSAKLYRILGNIIESRTPPLGADSASSKSYGLDYDTVQRFENEIESWHNTVLPAMTDERMLRSQILLRLQHAAVQIALYRPFLHHICADRRSVDFSYRGYACGSSCLRASTQMILVVETMKRHDHLHEAQWYTIYSLALAASSLMLFVMSNEDDPTVEDCRNAASRAMELLQVLGKKNMSAQRCYESLMAFSTHESVTSAVSSAMSPRSYFFWAVGADNMET